MELVRMYRNKTNKLHHEGCLLNKWGIILMIAYDEDKDNEKVIETNPDKKWHTNYFNNEYFFM